MAAEEENTTSFKSLGLCDQLVEAVAKLQWKSPTPIQAEVIPHALQGKDLIALSQTGSGKTGAFVLPILQALVDSPQPFFALVLSPTRELALQIVEQFQALGSGFKSVALVGGESEVQQSNNLAKRPHIIVATPGRLLQHLTNTRGFSLGTIKFLVLDEADRLLGEEFQKPTNEILKVIPHGGKRRTYLFSATMTNKVKKVARAGLRHPLKIEVASKYSTVDSLKQQMMRVPVQYKGCYLVYLLTQKCQRTAIVFTEKCAQTPFLACMLRNLGIKAIPLHGQMSQSERVAALDMFKAGAYNVLVCTNLLSRGLDIPSVDMVINYNIPENPKIYIHRVGRTARAGRSGIAISLVNKFEVENFKKIESLMGKTLPKHPATDEEVMQLCEGVREAARLAAKKMKESGGKKRKWGGDDDDDEEEGSLKYLNHMDGKSKKCNRRYK